jgi:hypothetical protein
MALMLRHVTASGDASVPVGLPGARAVRVLSAVRTETPFARLAAPALGEKGETEDNRPA